MSTPHLQAEPGDYADTVLMPGDPLRAKFIAESYLSDVTLVNEVRNMLGFTGRYNGRRVSVQGSGMGVPSIQIYATELIKDFGVTRIIRVGSCGAIQDEIDLGDVVIGLAAGTDSTVNRRRLEGRDFPAVADYGLLRAVTDEAERRAMATRVGSVFTSDIFYEPEGSNTFALLERYGFLAVEMEAAGLYGVAAEYGAAALTVATVSDQLKRGEHMSAADRQTSFDDMIRLVLDAVTAD
ncbi:MAG: purine-nucleoside phosphorylase [Acidimicrobiales bacterium]